MALTVNMQFEAELLSRVGEMRKRKLDQLGIGGGITDFAAYREQVGYLRALSEVTEACSEVQAELNKR